VAAAVFEFVDRLHQSNVAFVDQLEELQAAVRALSAPTYELIDIVAALLKLICIKQVVGAFPKPHRAPPVRTNAQIKWYPETLFFA